MNMQSSVQSVMAGSSRSAEGTDRQLLDHYSGIPDVPVTFARPVDGGERWQTLQTALFVKCCAEQNALCFHSVMGRTGICCQTMTVAFVIVPTILTNGITGLV